MPRIVTIVSFGYANAAAVPEFDLALDIRRSVPTLDDPALVGMTGLDLPVQQRILASPEARSLAAQIAVTANFLMEDNDFQELAIVVGSASGRRRSVVVARHIQTRLAQLNTTGRYTVAVTHRDAQIAVGAEGVGSVGREARP
ncbi:hypothetical protein [Streptomyces sp. NPDC056056]|uniref:RapZ C-terminal domain-containing protein n=1 Tax=Streptomyces sp. NPDC056056 TaxID=3345698 RepID=UPI0035E10D9D